jgi:hypothetical protein
MEGCGIPHLAKNERDMGHPLVPWLGWVLISWLGWVPYFQERSVELQIPPLRFAPVGMTRLFRNAKFRFQNELSSRTRSPRVLFEGLYCSLAQELFGSLDEAAVGGYG